MFFIVDWLRDICRQNEIIVPHVPETNLIRSVGFGFVPGDIVGLGGELGLRRGCSAACPD